MQLVSRARCLSISEQRPGELYMDRSLESYRVLIDRAEIWAFLQLLERTLGDLVVGTDCDYLVRCFHKRWWARKGCFKNGDLWCRIGTALNRRRKVIVYKVKAHVLAPDSPRELAAHTWTSVVGNELADAFAEKGALLHEVPIDVVRAVSEADFLAVRTQKQLFSTAIQAVPEKKGSAKAPGSREARRLTLPPIDGCYGPRFAARSAQVAGAVALLSLRTQDCPQATSRMAVERTLCPAVADDASGPLPRWSTFLDWPAGHAWLPQIDLQAGYLVVRGMRLLGFFGSAKLEQCLVRAKPRRQRETFWLVWTRGSRRKPHVQWQSPHY